MGEGKYWDGDDWVFQSSDSANDKNSVSLAVSPTASKAGDLGIDPNTSFLSYFNGSTWLPIKSSILLPNTMVYKGDWQGSSVAEKVINFVDGVLPDYWTVVTPADPSATFQSMASWGWGADGDNDPAMVLQYPGMGNSAYIEFPIDWAGSETDKLNIRFAYSGYSTELLTISVDGVDVFSYVPTFWGLQTWHDADLDMTTGNHIIRITMSNTTSFDTYNVVAISSVTYFGLVSVGYIPGNVVTHNDQMFMLLTGDGSDEPTLSGDWLPLTRLIGDGLVLMGNTVTIDPGYTALAKRYAINVPDGLTSVPISHMLGTTDIVVQVIEIATGQLLSIPAAITSADVVTLTFSVAPAVDQYRVIVLA